MLLDAVGGEYFASLTLTFFRHTEKTLSELDEAVAGEQAQRVRELCHSLKSSALQMGCQSLANHVDAAGAAAKTGDSEACAHSIAAAHEAFRRAREVLAELGENL